jgi:hypothetical protein
LLEQAEREQAEQAERAWQKLLGEHYRRAWQATEQPTVDPRAKLTSLAS